MGKTQSNKNVLIHYAAPSAVEEIVLKVLTETAEDENLAVTFMSVRKIIEGTQQSAGAVLSSSMGDHVGIEIIGKPDTVIWMPGPDDADWFAHLENQGHDGKRILISTLRWSALKFGPSATHTFPSTEPDIVEKILKVVNPVRK